MTAPRFHRIVTIERFIVDLIVEAVRLRATVGEITAALEAVRGRSSAP
jgi:methylmalonyl-CoA mutase N-terminal domain/subunit